MKISFFCLLACAAMAVLVFALVVWIERAPLHERAVYVSFKVTSSKGESITSERGQPKSGLSEYDQAAKKARSISLTFQRFRPRVCEVDFDNALKN